MINWWMTYDCSSNEDNIPILPLVPQAQEVSLDQVQDSLYPQPEREVLFTASLQEQLLVTQKKPII